MTLLFALACTQDPIVVGAKPFSEQRILGEALRTLLAHDGERVAPLSVCEDTWDCQHRLQSGELDLAVEYTGTGLALLSTEEYGTDLERLRAAYGPLDVVWLEPLGFDNGYEVLVPDWRAVTESLATISDLSQAGPVRLAVPPEFVRRPVDGLSPMSRRYGMQLEEPILIADVGERLAAVVEGRADAAIGYTTDGALGATALVPLEDDLGFFPAYEAVPVANADRLDAHPSIARAADRLAGELDDRGMQALNHQVDVAGYAPNVVARRWLREEGHVEGPGLELSAPAGLVVDPTDGLEAQVEPARAALRDALPDQPVRLVEGDPVEALASGEARVAVMGAERFFVRTRAGKVERREELIAEAVVGTRLVHLLRPRGATGEPATIGTVGSESGAAQVAALAWPQAEVVGRAGVEELLADVASGDPDAGLVLMEAGDPRLTDAVTAELELVPVVAPRNTDLAWLRPARILAGTLPGQTGSVDTVSVQVLVASASRPSGAMLSAGPVAALPSNPRPLDREAAGALVEALATAELPDPVLPRAAATVPTVEEDHRLLDTALNVLVLAFLIALVRLAFGSITPVEEGDRGAV